MPMSPRLLRPIAARGGFNFNPDNLVLVYDTSLEPENNTISVPIFGATPSVIIDWGDGTSESHTTTGFKTHTYANPGVYVVQVSGTLRAMTYGGGGATTNNKQKLVRCLSFGNVGITALTSCFTNCIQFIQCPASLPTTSNVTSLTSAFQGCTKFNDARVAQWNTAQVTIMTNMFNGATAFSADLGQWNLSALNASGRLNNFLANASLLTPDYDATLIGWESNKASFRNDLTPNMGGSKYTAGGAAEAARTALVNYGWSITDGGVA
jgi:hypothetical protein